MTDRARSPCGVPGFCHGPWPRLQTVERANRLFGTVAGSPLLCQEVSGILNRRHRRHVQVLL